MARLALTVAATTLGSYPTLQPTANSADFAFTAAGADFADGFSFPWNGNAFLLVKNGNVGAQTITIESVADGSNREGDITTYSIGAGEYAVFGPFLSADWRQTSNGLVHGAVTAADVSLAVIVLNFNV